MNVVISVKTPEIRHQFDLPEIGHRPGDRASRIGQAHVVGVGHAGDRYTQLLILARGGIRRVGRGVEDGQRAHRLVVQAGENDRLIGELQPLDVAERIGTVGTDVVGHGDDIIAEIERRAAIVDGDGVVRQRPGEHGRVEVGAVRVEQLADDPELAGAVHARDHGRDEIDHAVDGQDFRQGVVGRRRIAHADAHVEPGIAIDQVVAAATFDDVAAVAAEDDVAAVEGGHDGGFGRCQQVVEEVLQTVDQRDIGEHAAGGAGSGDAGRVDIVAAQHFAECRSRQPFHGVEPGEDRCPGSRHRRLVEEAVDPVDGHADRVALERGPIETGGADVTIAHAGAADHDVVAAFAVEFVIFATADIDVVADNPIKPERVEIIARGAVRGPPLDRVVPFVAHILFVTLGAEDEVVTGAAEGNH